MHRKNTYTNLKRFKILPFIFLYCTSLLLLNCSGPQPSAPAHIETPLIFEEAFSPGTQFWVNKEAVFFRVVNLGKINILSGQLVVGDPNIENQKPFTTRIPPGNYPVQIAIAQLLNRRFNAFLKIQFSDHEIEYWKMALRPEQSLKAINATQFYGVVVKSEKIMVSDPRTYHRISSAFQNHKAFTQFVDEKFNQLSGFSNIDFKTEDKQNLNFFIATPGVGNGTYAAYFGFDAEHKITSFLIDFYVIPWAKL